MAESARGYGEPGRRVPRSPFVFGLLATSGALVAIVAFAGVRRTGTVLAMLVAAAYFAIGLDIPVTAMVRRGLRRGTAVLLIALAALVVAVAVLAAGLPAAGRPAERVLPANCPTSWPASRPTPVSATARPARS